MKTSLIFAGTFTLISLSCGKERNIPPEREKEWLLTKIVTSSTITTYTYDGQGRASESTVTYPAGPANNYTSTYTYNDKGQLAEWYIQPDDAASDAIRIVFAYNGDSRIAMTSTYTVNGEVQTLVTELNATYGEGKAAIHQTDYPDGVSYLEMEYFTDDKGNLTKQKSYRSDGAEWITTEYPDYDTYPASGTSLPVTAFYKNANNYLSVKITDHETGNVGTGSYAYEYSDEGYPVKRTTDAGIITTYEYSYQ